MISDTSAAALARSAAASNGLTLSPEAHAAATARLAADLTHDDNRQLTFDGAPPFRFEAGQVVDVGLAEHIIAVVRELGSPVAAPAATAPAPGSSAPAPARPKPGGAVSEIGRLFEAMHDNAMIAETEDMKNPWLPGQVNRTNQMVITNKNPGLAARYKAQAGI